MRIQKSAKIEKCTSTDEYRPQLHSAYLDLSDTAKPMLVATNGYLLVALPVEAGEGDTQGFVSADALAAARKAAKRSAFAEIKANGSLAVPASGATFARPEGEFPNWRALMPKADRAVRYRIALDASYLLALAQGLSPDSHRVVLEFGEPTEPIRVTGCGADGGVGILMPSRLPPS